MCSLIIIKRLISEASPDEMKRMNNCFIFLDTSPYPMKEHCCLMMSVLDEIIVNKMHCASCIKDLMKKITRTHSIYGLTNRSDLYKVSNSLPSVIFVCGDN